MSELSALNVRITGDAGSLKAAVNGAQTSLGALGRVMTAAEGNARGFDRALRNSGGAMTDMQRRIGSLTGAMGAGRKTAEASANAFLQLGNAAGIAGNQLNNANSIAKAVGAQIGKAGLQTANLAAQFNDIGVMLAAGQNPLLLALQQGTQINQALSDLETTAERVSAIYEAISSVFDPANLTTLGLIAGGAALVQWGIDSYGASESAITFEDSLKSLQGTIEDMKTPMDILQMSTDQLIEKYGHATERVLRFAHAQAELAAAQAASRMSEQVAILDDVTRKYTVANNAGRDYANTIARIGRDFGLAKSEAQQFESMLEEINNAGSLEEQQAALQKVLDFLEDNNVELTKIPPELQRAISEMITLSNETDRARAIMDQLAAASRGVTTGVPLYEQGHDSLLPPAPPGKDPGTGGRRGGGGGAPKVNPLIAELEQVEQALMTQEELQLQSYMRQQETLQNALDQRLLTQQEYNSMMQDAQAQHQEKMAGIDTYRYGSGVQQTAKFMGDMAAALHGGNEKMQKIAQKFAAIETLINAWRAYGQTLADPMLPWYAKIPAAAGMLAAGMGAVNAIKGGSKSGGGGAGASSAGGASASSAAPAQQPNVQTLNFSVQNDPFGISDRVIRQIVGSINEAQRNGSTLIRATVT